jgi:transposase
MNGILFVLKTGCQWKALDATSICSGSVAHQRFQAWTKAGVFHDFWVKGLERYDEVKGIDWSWLSLDGTLNKAPVAGSKKQAKTRRIVASRAPSAAS